MNTEITDNDIDHVSIVSDIVAVYVTNNHVAKAELPNLIATVHTAIKGLSAKDDPGEPASERPTPAQIRKSITRDNLISFIDGRSYKTLKRHLANYGLTPDTYRDRFGLPIDYPMVAPSYSEKRSALAKLSGLGIRNRHK